MLDFYKGKRVLITGHTGFKGSWLSTILVNAGASVVGFSSCSKTEIRLFNLCEIKKEIVHIKGNVQNFQALFDAFQKYKPEIVFHMAAQPLVRLSYEAPVETYATNVMGTVNLLEAVKLTDSVKSVVNITTDKVYENKEWEWGYRENEPLDGYDPYSNSKSCSELVTHAYNRSFFSFSDKAISTARAGNVIGGGDFAKDRIIPDCVRSAIEHKTIVVRNPHSIRPYQHVLEPLFAYILIAEKQYQAPQKYSNYYNIGPNENDCIKTGDLVELFCQKWQDNLTWIIKDEKNAPHEATFLKLDCSRIKDTLGWKPRWNINKAVEKTVEWSKTWKYKRDVRAIMNKQINDFLGD